ncbi:MAG: hypothetical protein HYV63_04965 [Candidatus Schekmanbacteria bacterium]|nr:hypothetical protein [Candidatus Schekmanbacteria bacterium]
MLKVKRNGKDMILPSGAKTVGDVLRHIESGTAGTTVTQLFLDGNVVDLGDRIVVESLGVDDVELLDVRTQDVASMVTRNLGHAREYLKRFPSGLAQLARHLRLSNMAAAAAELTDVVEALQWFLDLFSGLEVLAGGNLAAVSVGGQPLSEFVGELRDFLTESLRAQEAQDWVLLADLLEYEVLPLFERFGAGIDELERWVDTRVAERRH